jgi:phosphatidylglycerophosphate synthase
MLLALLAVLDLTVGLGTGGWFAATVYGIAVCTALTWGMHRSAALSFGPANWVTLTRAMLAGGVTALVADSFAYRTQIPVLIGLCVAALLLDAIDGFVARRTNTATALGARFDMEVDAFLILVLSVYVSQGLGPWVLAIGAMRYTYWLALWLVPWLPGQLPPRYWRKVVAAVQGIVLAVAAAGVLPRLLVTAAVLGALVLLAESFGRDVWWRWQDRPRHHHLEMRHESV